MAPVEELRPLWQDGLDSGPLEPLDMAAIRAEARRRLRPSKRRSQQPA